MTRPQVASRSEVARGLRARVCAATPRRGSLLYSFKLLEAGRARVLTRRIGRAALVAAAICVATAPSPSYADTTISGNITLTADTDWRADGVVTVPEGVTVDLNGYTLWVSGLAGAGTFTSSVAAPATFDLTTADASKVSSPTTFPSGVSPANFFNNNFDRGDPTASDLNSRRIIVPNENLPIIVDYDFGAATSVNSYKVYAGGYRGGTSNQNSGHQRTAKHWKFYGSNDEGDEKTWTPLDERTVTDWNDKTAPDCKQFTFFNGTAYRYYRMEIIEPQELSNGHTELVQLEYGHVSNQVRLDLSSSAGFAAASNTVSGTAKVVVVGGTLSANVDLRGLGKVTLDGDIDLNGCVVRAAALDGAGKVTSTFSDSGAFDLTTTQTDDSNVKSYFGDSTEPRAFNTQPAWKAFADYASYTAGDQRVIDTTADYPKHIVYDFGTPTFIDVYKLMLGTAKDSAPKRAPKTIAFSGSNDGTTWTTLDSRPSETGWSASQERTYSFPSERAYRYYRISFSANNEGGNIIEFFRLQYGRQNKNALVLDMAGLATSDLSNISISGSGRVSVGDAALSGDLQLNTGWKSKLSIDGTIDLRGNELAVAKLDGPGVITDTTAMLDLTDSDASRVWSPNTYYETNAGTAKDAFSNPFVTSAPSSTKTRVMADASQLPVVIDYDFRTATVVDRYRLTTGDNVTRSPGAWEIYGSNDDAAYRSGVDELSAWKRLDTRFGETWSATFETHNYGFSNSTAYRYYRIRFTATAGAGIITFWKLQYCSTENCGHLHVVVPNGSTIYNNTVSLTGNLRVVKEGTGVFIPVKQNQSYNGGTDITAGTLKPGVSGDTLPLGAKWSDITVRKNATCDMNGKSGCHYYGFTLDGGTVKGTTADVKSASMITRMRLTDDSLYVAQRDFGFYGENGDKPTFVDLGGHTLEIQISAGRYFRNYNTTYINGTVDITSGGWFLTGGSYVTASNVDFKMKCALYMASPFSVRGYEAKFYSEGSNHGATQLTVAGVFKPTVLSYYGCTMLAGSTMDLAAWPGSWPMSSAFGANGKTNLEFADSGEIAVNLAGRTDLKALARSANPLLFTWTVTNGEPVVPGADFVLDPATAAAGFRLRKGSTGLRLVYTKGMMIIVK